MPPPHNSSRKGNCTFCFPFNSALIEIVIKRRCKGVEDGEEEDEKKQKSKQLPLFKCIPKISIA